MICTPRAERLAGYFILWLQKPPLLARIEIVSENICDSTIRRFTALEFNDQITGRFGHYRHFRLFVIPVHQSCSPIVDDLHPGLSFASNYCWAFPWVADLLEGCSQYPLFIHRNQSIRSAGMGRRGSCSTGAKPHLTNSNDCCR